MQYAGLALLKGFVYVSKKGHTGLGAVQHIFDLSTQEVNAGQSL